MSRSRIPAVAAVAALLAGGVLVWGGGRPTTYATPNTAPSLKAALETAPLVDPEVLALHAAEPEIIEEATVSTVTTTISSTTTTIPATTTTSGAAATTSAPAPSPTSPPTTQAPTTTAAPSGGFHSGAESEFASNINSYRGSNGLSGLSRAGSLDSHARSWAQQMAANGSISHSNIGALLGEWSSVGENIGVGGSVSAIFNALVDSSSHSDNMLGDFTHFGIGVYEDSEGNLWTCHVFAR